MPIMTEREAIERADRPASVASLRADLARMGIEPGMTVMVHSSLARLGFVAGGAQAVVTALLDSVTTDGTLMMPTHSGALSDPAAWKNPPIPQDWWPEVRATMPAFDRTLTPTRAMGAIVECFRHVPGVIRSNHPIVSAAAVGPNAEFLTSTHALEYGLGEDSPQARLYDVDGHILLLGVTHANNTSLHLGEYRSPSTKRWTTRSSPIVRDGHRQWVSYPDLDEDESDFELIGDAFAAAGFETHGPVGAGEARLMRSRDLVDFAVDWMNEHRA